MVFPQKISGFSENILNGFIFKNVAYFHEQNLEKEFYSSMFVTQYNDYTKIKRIKNKEEFAEAIFGARFDNYEDCWKNNLNKFITRCSDFTKTIMEVETSLQMGNTLGEMSLVFYKYTTYNNNEWDILIIDQPEDNIWNYKINEELIEYFNGLRDKKQIIFITHNPLLVVNLDVDNVIYLEKKNNIINSISGCLEDEENNILDIVADKMDGGKDTIQRRLKMYGKSNWNNNEKQLWHRSAIRCTM